MIYTALEHGFAKTESTCEPRTAFNSKDQTDTLFIMRSTYTHRVYLSAQQGTIVRQNQLNSHTCYYSEHIHARRSRHITREYCSYAQQRIEYNMWRWGARSNYFWLISNSRPNLMRKSWIWCARKFDDFCTYWMWLHILTHFGILHELWTNDVWWTLAKFIPCCGVFSVDDLKVQCVKRVVRSWNRITPAIWKKIAAIPICSSLVLTSVTSYPFSICFVLFCRRMVSILIRPANLLCVAGCLFDAINNGDLNHKFRLKIQKLFSLEFTLKLKLMLELCHLWSKR